MNVLDAPKFYTPEDLLRMPEGNGYELIDGQLVEREMSALACYIAGQLFEVLQAFVKKHRLGIVFADGTTYQCFAHRPEQVRRPDCGFIRADRYSLEDLKEDGHIQTVPDLVAEVVSTHDTVYETQKRVEDYLKAGVEVVWVLDPVQQTVQIHRHQGQGTILRAEDELRGEGALDAFRVRVSELFALPTWLKVRG